MLILQFQTVVVSRSTCGCDPHTHAHARTHTDRDSQSENNTGHAIAASKKSMIWVNWPFNLFHLLRKKQSYCQTGRQILDYSAKPWIMLNVNSSFFSVISVHGSHGKDYGKTLDMKDKVWLWLGN